MRPVSRLLLPAMALACAVALLLASGPRPGQPSDSQWPMSFSLDAPFAHAGGSTGPRFTWASFRFFWNKHTPPEITLNNPVRTEEGYLCEYGHTVSVLVLATKNDGVLGARVRFLSGPGNDAGGPKFTRLVNHAIDVGTFRWPDDVIAQCREHFRYMGKANKNFRYQNTEFSLTYNEHKGWTFSMIYL